MSDETPIRWTRERRRQDDGNDLHPFLSAVTWSAAVMTSTLAAWQAWSGGESSAAWFALSAGGVAFVLAYPVLIYLNFTGAFYEREREEPIVSEVEPPAARPFVSSQNAPATIRVGSWSLPRASWLALFAVARANDGRLTRDAVVKADALPRDRYRDWRGTMGELERLGFVDESGCVTSDGWAFAREISPSPNGGEGPARPSSTHARRTHGAHGPDLVTVGEAD